MAGDQTALKWVVASLFIAWGFLRLWPIVYPAYREFRRRLAIEQQLIAQREESRRRLSRSSEQPLHDVLDDERFQQFMHAAPKEVVNQDYDSWGMMRQLVRVRMRREEDVRAVLVHDSTLGKPVYIRVPPRTKTCQEAVAWTFGMEAEEYDPDVET